MHTLLIIGDRGFPDPVAKRTLLDAGIDAREGAPAAEGPRPEAVLFDLAAPLDDVLRRCREMRALEANEEAPTIIALDRGEVTLLSAGKGADDFIVRPIDPGELVARVRFLLWRAGRVESDGVVRRGEDLAIDTVRYEVTVTGRRVDLTLKEYELLLFLARHPGRVFTRDILLDRIWGQHYFGGTRTVDVHIRRLRMKLERGGRTYIDTVRGVGYRFVE